MFHTPAAHLPIDPFASVGIGMSGEDRLCLSTSMVALQASQNFAYVEFWGIIQTCDCSKDYYVATAGKEPATNNFSSTTIFTCQDALNWVQLPPVSDEEILNVAELGTLFSGDPNFEHVIPPSPKSSTSPSITELKRISAFVRLIQSEATIVPRNAYIRGSKPKLLVKNNPYFRGLNTHEFAQLSTFGHLRPPLKHDDQLDSIESDIPGCWTFHVRPMFVIVSNLVWPGYFHYANNVGAFASVYIGHGRKNMDLGFML